MYIYKYGSSTGYELGHPIDARDWDVLAELHGAPRSHDWKPIRVRRVRPSLREGFRASDSPYCGSGELIFRRSAVDALRDILDAHGELLPLEDEGGVELYAYNPRALEALDQEKTYGSRDKNGIIELPNCHVFIPSVIEGVDIFRQARVQKRNAWIYLSDRFLQRWKQAKLKGLDFTLVWDSNLPPDQQPNVWTSKPVKL
jgi:hypothetical protein